MPFWGPGTGYKISEYAEEGHDAAIRGTSYYGDFGVLGKNRSPACGVYGVSSYNRGVGVCGSSRYNKGVVGSGGFIGVEGWSGWTGVKGYSVWHIDVDGSGYWRGDIIN